MLFILGLSLLSACPSRRAKFINSNELRNEGSQALVLCLKKIRRVTNKPLSYEADRAYVYIDDNSNGIFVMFTHGGWGTFSKRSPRYYLVVGCGILRLPSMRVVTLDSPMRNSIFDAPGADYFYFGKGSKPTDSMELWYSRESSGFHFIAMQRFSMNNYYRNNPKPKKRKCDLNPKAPPPATPPSPEWTREHPGCASTIGD